MDGPRLGPDETLGSVLAAYDEVAADTETIVAHRRPRPAGAGSEGPAVVSVRCGRVVGPMVLLHLIEETARHADIVREHVDGALAVPLMAAAEGWPVTPWTKAEVASGTPR
jgi:Protein of unknown function (DUF664)